MNLLFIIILAAYFVLLFVMGIIDMRRVKNFTDYAVAGKNQTIFAVTMTLLATMLGASATIGIADTTYRIGFPAIWWLTFGSIGLVAQSFLISERVRRIGADTLPDLAGKTVGKAAETLLAAVIVISWVGVIAGQLVAMNGIITFALGSSSKWLFVIVSLLVILYTFIGGQMSVIRTDRLQLLIIAVGVIATCIWLYCKGSTENIMTHIELFNNDYHISNWLMQLFIIGGVYFLGPDIMSRNFISKDERTAKRSSLFAGIAFLGFAIIIVLVGMWLRYNVTPEVLNGNKALMWAAGYVPPVIGVVLVLGLLSAVLSSTDTCLINASSILVRDILHKDSVLLVRIAVCVIGLAAMIIALLGRGDIIGLLTSAYAIYTPGVICPLTVAIFAYNKKKIRIGVWMAAVCFGGVFGLLGSVFAKPLLAVGLSEGVLNYFPLIGMGISLMVAIGSLRGKVEEKTMDLQQ